MDYWPKLDLVQHPTLESWMQNMQNQELVLLSTKGTQDFSASKVPQGAHLVFGSEGAGLPEAVWKMWPDKALKIPMKPEARSINLSASVSLVLGGLLFG